MVVFIFVKTLHFSPAKTNKIPHTKVRCFLLVLHCPTKQMMIPIVNISKLANGNHVDRRIVTEKYNTFTRKTMQSYTIQQCK